VVNKAGDEYEAQREGEPAVYVIDSAAFDDLLKQISGIKPAPKPAAKSDQVPILNGLLTDLYELTMAAGYYGLVSTRRSQPSSFP